MNVQYPPLHVRPRVNASITVKHRLTRQLCLPYGLRSRLSLLATLGLAETSHSSSSPTTVRILTSACSSATTCLPVVAVKRYRLAWMHASGCRRNCRGCLHSPL